MICHSTRNVLTKISPVIELGLHHEGFDEACCFFTFSQELLKSGCI